MTDKQKNDQWTGLYKDNDQTEWEWTCKVPPPKGAGGDDLAGGKYSTKGNTWMEILLWITYISGVFWVFGYLVQLPLGFFVMTWLSIDAMITFFDIFAGGDFMAWLAGPWRRSFVGSIIFSLGVFSTIIPVFDWVALPLLGWWAVADYYDYDYTLFA